MSLRDDLQSEQRRKSGPRCIACDWYQKLDDKARADFDDYVAIPGANRALLYRVITEKWGYTGCSSALRGHLLAHHGSR